MSAAPGGLIRYPFEVPPEGPEAIEVAEGILWLRQPLPMALDHVNIYALDDGDSWTVIDTGFDTGRSRALWETWQTGALGGKPIGRVIVTHHHPDHIGLAGWLQGQGAALWAPRTAWLLARMLVLDEEPRPGPETLAYWRAGGMDAALLAQRCEERPFNFVDMVHPLPPGYRRIQEGDVIEAGGRVWDVRMGNGHAPEHATLWCRDAPLILAGDQMLPSISPNLGVYPSEPEADPVAEWLDSCERFVGLAQEDHLVLGGHKLPFTGLPARLRQLIGNHHNGLERLVQHLSEPRTAVDCFAVLFKRSIGPGEYGLALAEALAHCLHLWHAGRVTRVIRDDGAWLWRAV